MLARKSLLTRVWMATGKKVYYAITRGLFRFTDREGGGRAPGQRRAATRRASRKPTHR